MARTIRITRVADPKVNLYDLSYPDSPNRPALRCHNVVLRGTTCLTLCPTDGRGGDRGMQFPGVTLRPGESIDTAEWRRVVDRGGEWVQEEQEAPRA